jgi:hypothetical protein
MMLNVRKRDLRNLSSYDYNVVATHVIDRKTIHKPIPDCTGHYGSHELPNYLKGFKDCYEYKFGRFYLKPEYRGWYGGKTPEFTLEVPICTYDVELTESGWAKVKARYEMYNKRALKYLALMA